MKFVGVALKGIHGVKPSYLDVINIWVDKEVDLRGLTVLLHIQVLAAVPY